MCSDVEDTITINQSYALKYKTRKQAEELTRLRHLHDDVTSSESSSDESEDEEGAWSAVTETEFLRTLSLLKNKDPLIYDQSTTFYTTTDLPGPETEGQSSKAMYLRDYERERLLKKGSKAELSDSEDEGIPHIPNEGNPRTYQDEQDELVSQFKVAVAEMDDPVLTLRTKTTSEKAKEEKDYRDWLKDNEGNKDLHGLRAFWGNPLLDTGEQFLRDYIIKGGHRDDTQLSVPTYDEVVGVASDTEDEKALQVQEEFERKFNFRYEEPESELIKSYPRTIASSVRSESHTRTANRQQRQERKKQEKERELEELRRLKNLKRREVDSRLKQLSQIAGNSVEGLGGQLNLDEDFDPQAYDQSMGEVFGDEYYEGGEDEGKPDIGEEELWEEEFHCEDPGFNMDADFDGVDQESLSMDNAESAEPVVKEGTFKYRSVLPNDFGLSTEEIIGCENKELNSWVSLSKMVQYRSEEEEKKDKKLFRKRGRDWSRKTRCLPSVYSSEHNDGTNTKAVKKTKKAKTKSKSITSNKLSKTRLKSYGL